MFDNFDTNSTKNSRAEKLRRDRRHKERDQFSDGIRIRKGRPERPRNRNWGMEDSDE